MEILEIASIIKNAGGRLYLVGGAVRDKLLGKENYDEDYCVTGITNKEFENLFKNAFIRGKSFQVYEIDKKEFAMARKERKTGLGHNNFEIETDKSITIEEDLKRRDITINSIAQDVLTGELIDPYSGLEDLENRIIKATSEAFIEDPLRVYRVARFASKLNFKVEENTLKMMNKLKDELKYLTEERVFIEFKKALATDRPSIFFNVLRDAKLLDIHFKEINNLIGSIQPEKYHPEGDSYNHTMIVVDHSAELTKNLEVRFSALVHDLGKGTTPKEMLPHHYGHEERGVREVERLGNRLNIPKSWMDCGKVSAKEHMRGGIFNKMTPKKQVEFIDRVKKSKLGLDGMEIVVTSDRWRIERPQDIIFAKLGREMLEQITGKYVKEKYKVKEGKLVGELIKKEKIEWMKNNIENEK